MLTIIQNCLNSYCTFTITNEIVVMVPITIDEKFGKFIFLDNEHDLTLFKLVEQKQMH